MKNWMIAALSITLMGQVWGDEYSNDQESPVHHKKHNNMNDGSDAFIFKQIVTLCDYVKDKGSKELGAMVTKKSLCGLKHKDENDNPNLSENSYNPDASMGEEPSAHKKRKRPSNPDEMMDGSQNEGGF